VAEEPLGLLLLPQRLEQFELQDHARGLLQIPRVIALEPGRARTPRFLRDAAPLRQAKRLKLPGRPRLVVLYHPSQYPLARALLGRYAEAELWYVRPRWEGLHEESGYTRQELLELDELAAKRSAQILAPGHELSSSTDELRARMLELEVISARPFVPGGRVARR
jgi:hypothetical protein